MKKLIIGLILLIALPVMAQTDDFRDEPGFVDFGTLNDRYGTPKVEINLGHQLLGFVSALSKNEDPETAEVLSKLKAVRVYVYELDDDATTAVSHIEDIASDLRRDNWQSVVVARDDGELVNVFVKMTGDVIDGLSVMAAGDDDEAVFINVIGELDPEQLSRVTDKFDIDLD